MGSIIAAGAALEWDDQELCAHMRAGFSGASSSNDYTLPMISLLRERKSSRFLRHHFGDHQIEDCPCPQIVAVNVASDRSIRASIDELEDRPLWELARHARRGTPNIFTLLVSAASLSGMRKSK